MKETVFNIANDELHLWHANLEISAAKEAKLFSLLSVDEQTRANRFAYPQHKKRFIAARAGLRMLLADYLNSPADDIVFSYSDKGKPYLLNCPVEFNLSHSEHMAVYAFMLRKKVGVDVEFIKGELNQGIAERFFNQDEYQALMKVPEELRKQTFYAVWVKKEALVKAKGIGLIQSLNEFVIDLGKDSQWVKVDGEDWFVQGVDVSVGYEAAVACALEPQKIVSNKLKLG